MTRPAIDPVNIRRQSTGRKTAAWWVRNVTTGTVLVLIMFGIASIDSLIP